MQIDVKREKQSLPPILEITITLKRWEAEALWDYFSYRRGDSAKFGHQSTDFKTRDSVFLLLDGVL